MDQLQGMRVFARVAELGSFARAADLLDMSRAMASSYVAQLEKHLGTRLLHRTTRKVTVSPEGAVYLERCRRILAELQAADDEMRHARARPQGKLRVDVPVAFGRYLLMPALPTFTERYPEMALEVRFNDRIVDLAAERIDVALRAGEIRSTRSHRQAHRHFPARDLRRTILFLARRHAENARRTAPPSHHRLPAQR